MPDGTRIDNTYMHERLQRRENTELRIFGKEAVIEMLQQVAKSPPTITDPKHQPHWWNEEFGKRIRADWADKINRWAEDSLWWHVARRDAGAHGCSSWMG